MKKIIFLFFLYLVAGCSSVPLTGRKQFVAIPSSQIIALNSESYTKVLEENQLSANQQYVSKVNRVGTRVTAAVESYLKQNGLEAYIEGYNWQYNVIASDALNAWCMPGGQIAFYEGIMPVCEDEEGIAVVMGHEIAHAVAQHGNERMEARSEGRPPEFLSTHPDPANRIENLNRIMPKAMEYYQDHI